MKILDYLENRRINNSLENDDEIEDREDRKIKSKSKNAIDDNLINNETSIFLSQENQ